MLLRLTVGALPSNRYASNALATSSCPDRRSSRLMLFQVAASETPTNLSRVSMSSLICCGASGWFARCRVTSKKKCPDSCRNVERSAPSNKLIILVSWVISSPNWKDPRFSWNNAIFLVLPSSSTSTCLSGSISNPGCAPSVHALGLTSPFGEYPALVSFVTSIVSELNRFSSSSVKVCPDSCFFRSCFFSPSFTFFCLVVFLVRRCRLISMPPTPRSFNTVSTAIGNIWSYEAWSPFSATCTSNPVRTFSWRPRSSTSATPDSSISLIFSTAAVSAFIALNLALSCKARVSAIR